MALTSVQWLWIQASQAGGWALARIAWLGRVNSVVKCGTLGRTLLVASARTRMDALPMLNQLFDATIRRGTPRCFGQPGRSAYGHTLSTILLGLSLVALAGCGSKTT